MTVHDILTPTRSIRLKGRLNDKSFKKTIS